MRRAKRALITGVNGQDGSYLAEHLVTMGYQVCGVVRRSSTNNRDNLTNLLDSPEFTLAEADMTDGPAIRHMIADFQPDEIYNLAAQTFVQASWDMPAHTIETNLFGLLHLLEAVRFDCPNARVYQASSSEMYGNTPGPLDENSPMIPRSPYGVSKLAAHRLARVYRESYGMFVACGICFNHESPRRGPVFVTRKIAHGVAAIVAGKIGVIHLGNLDARRDWGHAHDFVRAIHMMLQAAKPADWVVATGVSHSVREFVEAAVRYAGLPGDPMDYVQTEPGLVRPAEIHDLVGNATCLRLSLGWQPLLDFDRLVRDMVHAEFIRARLSLPPSDSQ